MDSSNNFNALHRKDILNLSNDDKMKYLKHAVMVKHSEMEKIGMDLVRLLTPNTETSIITIIGATGVGKTTLTKILLQSAIQKKNEEKNSSSIPYLYVSVPSTGQNKLPWKEIYEAILKAGKEILINAKQYNETRDEKMFSAASIYKDLAARRGAVESMLNNRKVQVLVIDEAYHLLRYGNYTAVMDTIKSLVDQTEIKLVLIGTFDLFDLITQYGQVARRSEILLFNRYNIDNKTHAKEFRTIIHKIQNKWPCNEVPPFISIYKELMQASLGCVGLLKAIMEEALNLQINNKGRWRNDFIFRSTKSLKLLGTIRNEIEAGEEKVKGATYGESLFSANVTQSILAKMSGEFVNA